MNLFSETDLKKSIQEGYVFIGGTNNGKIIKVPHNSECIKFFIDNSFGNKHFENYYKENIKIGSWEYPVFIHEELTKSQALELLIIKYCNF